ncbi:unnamed protein product [Linum tenue]|uniref:Uncharacterized protein n=1 Tax=Linum tenue TaxID=586396 RepID=A0AAV0Q2X3_9ROSI|nr:unnamed protein product [Linum tenue]
MDRTGDKGYQSFLMDAANISGPKSSITGSSSKAGVCGHIFLFVIIICKAVQIVPAYFSSFELC